MGVTISSNYYEENNIVPIRFATSSDRHPIEVICTDLLLNGDIWNQSYVQANAARMYIVCVCALCSQLYMMSHLR